MIGGTSVRKTNDPPGIPAQSGRSGGDQPLPVQGHDRLGHPRRRVADHFGQHPQAAPRPVPQDTDDGSPHLA